MKKGFFLLAAMAALFNNSGIGGNNIHNVNTNLKNAPPRTTGGTRIPTVTNILIKKLKSRKRKARIVKRSRNINNNKAA